MFLYLFQHVEAKPENEDPQIGISDKVMQYIKKIASFIGKLNLQVDEIFHSGKLREKQTAEVLADTLKVKVSETDGLAPINNPEIWEDRLKKLINP